MALVTGAATEFAAQIAVTLARQGAGVILSDKVGKDLSNTSRATRACSHTAAILLPHPESGFYHQTYRAPLVIGQSALPPAFHVPPRAIQCRP
jgi:NAD(P)-dependent dehydrogenase (short-subunit alcohol dehydrogenase family)